MAKEFLWNSSSPLPKIVRNTVKLDDHGILMKFYKMTKKLGQFSDQRIRWPQNSWDSRKWQEKFDQYSYQKIKWLQNSYEILIYVVRWLWNSYSIRIQNWDDHRTLILDFKDIGILEEFSGHLIFWSEYQNPVILFNWV